MKVNEENFLAELKGKNPLAIEFIVHEYGALIKSVLHPYLRGSQQALEECFNDILLALWNHAEQFDDKKSQFKSWLCAIARYRAIDTLRRETKHRERFLPIDDESNMDWLDRVLRAEQTDGGEEEAFGELKKLLGCLSEADRDLFFRRYVSEQSVEEIAAEKKMKPSLIYSRISRGRKKMKRYMECQNGGALK